MKLHGLYAITPERLESGELIVCVRAALEGGLAALQYRRKGLASLEEAKAIAALCRAKRVPFIVNDDVGLALACSADGVHIGKDDGNLVDARKRMTGKILGVSCYASLSNARAAAASGADYVAFGSVFASPTKPGTVRAPLSLFAEARSLGVPLAAIGGITLENAPQLLAAGVDALAVITDLFGAKDIAAQARAYGRLFAHEIPQ